MKAVRLGPRGRALVDVLAARGPLTVTEIAEALGWERVVANRAVSDWLKNGTLRVVEVRESTRARAGGRDVRVIGLAA